MGLGTREGGKEGHRWVLLVAGHTLVDRKLAKKEGLMRRGKDDQRRETRTHRTCCKAYKTQIINTRKDDGRKVNRVLM